MTPETHTRLPNLLTTAKAAEYLGRSPLTLTDWRFRRIGPPWVKMEGGIRYNAETLRVWLEEREGGPA